LQTGDLARAEAAGNAVLAMPASGNSNRALALNILGIVSDQRQDLTRAEDYYNKALVADPSLTAAHNNLGNLYFKLKKERQAILQYQLVLRADPSNTEANLNLGLIYQAGGKPDQAISHLEKARQRAAGDARLMLTLAGLYFESDQKEKALA